jgi:nitrogen fixation protein NifU and related proteins
LEARRRNPERSEGSPSGEGKVSYTQTVLDHFEHPRNVGDLADADAEVRLEHPVCGDIMKLAVKLAGGRIGEVRFRTRGCVASIAAGSCLTEMIAGKSLAEAAALQRDQLVVALGGLSNASIHASHLAMDALQQVLSKLKPAG